MIEFLRTVRFYLIPRDSRREKVYHVFRVVLLSLKLYGLRITARQSWLAIRSVILDRREGLGTGILYTYQDWIRRNEPDSRALARQRSLVKDFRFQPLICILTPVYNPQPDVLRDTIQSVIDQTYEHWELWLANASDQGGVREVIDMMAARDQRIRPLHLERNLGIAGNTNQALQAAEGEFIALLDHDDLLSPNTLFEAVTAINANPETDLVYYDEDKVSEDGKSRRDPWFKPSAYSPDLLISNNYLMHAVIRKSLVEELGGFDPEVDGAQDWDLSLKISERTRQIVHVPKVLYHWRQVEGSAARDANAKPWAFAAQERCILNALQRQGYADVPVSFEGLGVIRVHWPTGGKRASIIIPTHNNLEQLQACLASILEKTTYSNYEILVVENNSTDPAVFDYYKSVVAHPQIRLLEFNQPFNYQTINNFASRQATGEVLVFLNNDTEILAGDWLEELIGQAVRPEVGVVGTKLLRPNGLIQHAGMIVGLQGHASHIFEDCPDHYYGFFGSTNWYRNYQTVTGACMAVRSDLFAQVGRFDEAYIVGYGDIDLCFRIFDLGYRIVYTPFARVLHYEGGTRGLTLPPSDVLRATTLMQARVQAGDPFFNPNLSYLYRKPTVVHPREEQRGHRLVRILRQFDLIEIPMDSDLWETSLLVLPLKTTIPATVKANQVQNILLVTHELTLSGAPIIQATVAGYLKEHGLTIRVISPVAGPLGERYEAMGIPVTIEPRLLDDARVILFHIDDIDTMLVNTILAWRTVHAARAFNRRCLWSVHESAFGQNLAQGEPAVQKAFQAADLVLFSAQATADLYQAFTNRANYRVAFTGLDIRIPAETAGSPPVKKRSDELFLVQVATFEHRKGQDILVDAMSQLAPDVASRVHLFFIGRHYLDRRFYRKVSRQARRLKNVTIVGELSNPEVWDYLKAADVFVLASRDESLPVSIIEAMAIGKTIIATAAGGVNEILHDGENGFVVAVEDAPGIAERITRLVQEPGLLVTLGEQARRSYEENLTIDVFGRKVHQIIQELPYISQPVREAAQPADNSTSHPFTQQSS